MTKNKRILDKSSRVITLGDINNDNACSVINFIYDINNEDEPKEADKRKPIQLIINSQGGSVYDGIGIVDVIEQSITPIHIYVHGQAQSMAFAIVTSGHYRYAGKRAVFMYHQVSWEMAQEKLIQHEQEVKEGKRLWKVYDDIVLTNTKIQLKQLKQIHKERKEWYLTAEEALKLGVIDEIL
jgi:ATP-dependent Clp protease protease subunit